MQPLLKARDVAKLLGINAETVKVYARDGTIAGLKIGNRWRFQPSTIKQFIDDQAKIGEAGAYDDEVVQFRLPHGRQQ